jgi:hypothetical protein
MPRDTSLMGCYVFVATEQGIRTVSIFSNEDRLLPSPPPLHAAAACQLSV